MKKSAAIITLSFLVWQCSEPIDTYYGFEDFDLLKVGSGISDLIVSKDGNTLVASDMSNNSLIFIDIKGEMSIETSLAVGSRPKSLDLSFTGDTLFRSTLRWLRNSHGGLVIKNTYWENKY